MSDENAINLLDLPDCMLEEIFSYLTYDEIAKKRLVNLINIFVLFVI